MARRTVSLWLPTFPTDRLVRSWNARARRGGRPPTDWRDRPLITVEGPRLVALNGAARAAGLAPGLPLAEARARVPGLVAAPADPAGDARALARLADWATRWTPRVAMDETHSDGGCGLWLDVTGCGRLFGGEAAILEELTGRLRALGYVCRAAAAPTPGAAWALARFGDEGVLADGTDLAALLAPLPTAALRLASSTVEGLDRVGLRRVGDLLELPRAALAARFGDGPAKRLDQALGRLDEALTPRRPPPPFFATRAFAEPLGRTPDIAVALDGLLDEVCAAMARSAMGARRLDLCGYRMDGGVSEVSIGTARPVRDAAHLARLFAEKLERLQPGFGFEVLALRVRAADPLKAAQESLPGTRDGADGEALDRLLDRLGNRLGFRWVTRLVAYAGHIPERACRPLPVSAPVPKAEAGANGPASSVTRPLHLLPWPAPIEAVAPVPDDPPVMFRWEGRRHRVVRADGPERVGGEWWLDDPAVPREDLRDYYRVEDDEGRRFWLFRQGLYRPGVRPRWFLHGLFP